MADNIFALDEIADIAIEARLEFIHKTINQRLLSALYRYHFPINPIHPHLPRLLQEFPNNGAQLATTYLQYIFGGEITKGQYERHNHYFLTLPRNVIVDITADQFGGPEIFVGKIRPPWYECISPIGHC